MIDLFLLITLHIAKLIAENMLLIWKLNFRYVAVGSIATGNFIVTVLKSTLNCYLKFHVMKINTYLKLISSLSFIVKNIGSGI